MVSLWESRGHHMLLPLLLCLSLCHSCQPQCVSRCCSFFIYPLSFFFSCTLNFLYVPAAQWCQHLWFDASFFYVCVCVWCQMSAWSINVETFYFTPTNVRLLVVSLVFGENPEDQQDSSSRGLTLLGPDPFMPALLVFLLQLSRLLLLSFCLLPLNSLSRSPALSFVYNSPPTFISFSSVRGNLAFEQHRVKSPGDSLHLSTWKSLLIMCLDFEGIIYRHIQTEWKIYCNKQEGKNTPGYWGIDEWHNYEYTMCFLALK